MPLNIFLLEILVDRTRLWTLPVISERSRIEFELLNDIRITVNDSEFKRSNEHSCNTCVFALNLPEVELFDDEEEEKDVIKSNAKVKTNVLAQTFCCADSPAPLPLPYETPMRVEVFKQDSKAVSQRIGYGWIPVSHLFVQIADTIAQYQRSMRDYEREHRIWELSSECGNNELPNSALSEMSVAVTSQDSALNSPRPTLHAEEPRPPERPYPIIVKYKALYSLVANDSNVGAISVLLRLTCFGRTVALSPTSLELEPLKAGDDAAASSSDCCADTISTDVEEDRKVVKLKRRTKCRRKGANRGHGQKIRRELDFTVDANKLFHL